MPHSYLDRLLPGRAGVQHRGSHTHEVGKELLDAAEVSGGAYVFGFLQHKYGERFSVKGVPGDLLAGLGLTLGSIVAEAKGWAPGVTGITKNLGHAGLAAFFHTIGAGHGSAKPGEARLRLAESDLAKAQKALAGAGVKTTVFGAIQKAPHGDFMTSRDLRALANG